MSEILSEHDLDKLGGASPLPGLRRTTPSWEKYPRPGREGSLFPGVVLSDGEGISQGEASACAAMMSSMLASPQGASEQYIWRVREGFQMKGGPSVGEQVAGAHGRR